MTIFDQVDFSPLRNVSQRKPFSLNSTLEIALTFGGGTPIAKGHQI